MNSNHYFGNSQKGFVKIELANRNVKKDGHCWKCDSIITTNQEVNQCQSCGYVTYVCDQKLLDEYEYWGEVKNIADYILDKYDDFFINTYQLGFNFEKRLVKLTESGLSSYQSYNQLFNQLIQEENSKEPIKYKQLALVYRTYARFLFETGNYFFEALDNYIKSELQNIYINSNYDLDAEITFRCMSWCQEIKEIQNKYKLKDVIQKCSFPVRSCKNTEYFDYENIEEIIENKIPVGFCAALISSEYDFEF
jgi:hypothetical protein